jgi:hypothetical protein
MTNNYELALTQDMAFCMQLGNNSIDVSGEEIEAPYINLAGTDAINISSDFIEIAEADKLFLRIKPELETNSNKKYKLHVPKAWKQDMQFEINNGSAGLQNLQGTIKAQLTHGHISLKDLSGTITTINGNGAINGENLYGKIELSTTNGTITLKSTQVTGGSIKNSNGKMSLQLTPVETGNMHIFSGNGQIELAVPEMSHYQLKIQTKAKLENHLQGCSVVEDKEVTTVQMGEGGFNMMIINFKGGVKLMRTQDFGKDWNKKTTWDFKDIKFPDAKKFFEDILNRDYSKDIPEIMKQIADFGSKFSKIGDELAKKFNQFQNANSRDDEIRIVLDMLQEGKITTEDAERLINAIKRK